MAKLAALNQATRLTAGTSAEAATNTENLLTKMGAQDTRNHFAKLGIRYDKRLAEGRMKGLDALDVTANIIEEQLAKDKNYQNALTKYRNAPEGSERKDALASVMNIAQGSAISTLFPDKEAMKALVGFLADRETSTRSPRIHCYMVPMLSTETCDGRRLPTYALNQAKQAEEFANYDAMMKLAPVTKAVANSFADLAKSSPQLAAAISGSITILQGLGGWCWGCRVRRRGVRRWQGRKLRRGRTGRQGRGNGRCGRSPIWRHERAGRRRRRVRLVASAPPAHCPPAFWLRRRWSAPTRTIR